jgi:5'-deoxynucleotidase YfbR-like HD superfamily hydrolase
MNSARFCDRYLPHDKQVPDLVTEILERSKLDIAKDVDALLWSHRLQNIQRYLGQPFWETETQDAEYAKRIIQSARLETVAEHSWNVADAVLLLAWRFPYLNDGHAVRLAVLHDKMEISVGDANPLGRDGTGRKGHAFNAQKEMSKEERERVAIAAYLGRLNDASRSHQHALLAEALECESPEARFVKAIDKMQALVFILLRKGSAVTDQHLTFLLRFTEKNNRYFPPLAAHNAELLRRMLKGCARQRGETIGSLVTRVAPADELVPFIGDGRRLPDRGSSPNLAPLGLGDDVPPKAERLRRIFRELELLPPARTGIEAVAQLANCVNRVEDEVWGKHWQPPRYVPPGTRTERLYPVAPDSTYPVPGWAVDVLVAHDENVYVGSTGAIEVQVKDRAKDDAEPWNASERVLFQKPDRSGNGVWHPLAREEAEKSADSERHESSGSERRSDHQERWAKVE